MNKVIKFCLYLIIAWVTFFENTGKPGRRVRFYDGKLTIFCICRELAVSLRILWHSGFPNLQIRRPGQAENKFRPHPFGADHVNILPMGLDDLFHNA